MSTERPPGRVVLAQVTGADLDPARCLALVSDPSAGGIGLFAGAVRSDDDGRAVTQLEYEAHPSAQAEIERLSAWAAAEPGVVAVAAEHRTGSLGVGELAIVVAVSAPHRAEALRTCHALVDRIKAEVPLWKHQHHPDGTAGWVGAE